MTPEEMAQNPFAACYAFRDMLGFKYTEADPRGPLLVGIFAKGDCPVFDYNCGVLCITLFVAKDNVWPTLRIHINSGDDSGATGWGKEVRGTTPAQARKQMFALRDELERQMGKEINWDTFTEVVGKFGIYMDVY